MAVVAVIPARGGSKRIPRKNIKPFHGKPVIAYAIEAAMESGVFDRVVVSTEDKEIAIVAQSYGAEAPFRRPAALADDHVTSTAVVAHATAWLFAQGVSLDAVCCLYATVPLLQPESICAGLKLLQSGNWDFVISATTFPYPIFRAFTVLPEGGLNMLQPEHSSTRSQDLPEAWHDAAQFCWGTPNAWLEGKPIFGRRSTVIKLPRWEAQDLDTPEDWGMAERLFHFMRQETHVS